MFTSVKKFENYEVGNSIKFWHWAERDWMQGKIVDIQQAQNTLVHIAIAYRARGGKTLETKIFREDWLKLPK